MLASQRKREGHDMKDDNLGKMETCSLCLREVRWTSLTETDSGNVCTSCLRDIYAETHPNY